MDLFCLLFQFNGIKPFTSGPTYIKVVGRMRVASCELRVASCELPVASFELPVASCQLPVTSCQLRVASCQLPVAMENSVDSSSGIYTVLLVMLVKLLLFLQGSQLNLSHGSQSKWKE